MKKHFWIAALFFVSIITTGYAENKGIEPVRASLYSKSFNKSSILASSSGISSVEKTDKENRRYQGSVFPSRCNSLAEMILSLDLMDKGIDTEQNAADFDYFWKQIKMSFNGYFETYQKELLPEYQSAVSDIDRFINEKKFSKNEIKKIRGIIENRIINSLMRNVLKNLTINEDIKYDFNDFLNQIGSWYYVLYKTYFNIQDADWEKNHQILGRNADEWNRRFLLVTIRKIIPADLKIEKLTEIQARLRLEPFIGDLSGYNEEVNGDVVTYRKKLSDNVIFKVEYNKNVQSNKIYNTSAIIWKFEKHLGN